MFKKLYNRLSIAKDWYHTYRKEIKLATNITVKNHLLYQELELECAKRSGILTYAEYLHIEQFGSRGYYAKSELHGKTDVEERWGEALAQYCQKYGHDTIIEFGCGTGELGVATAHAYKKLTSNPLTWTGVEIDTRIHEIIRNNFTKYQLRDSLGQVVRAIDEIPALTKPLIVFPYSLDNIPPQVFLNTQFVTTYPNALLGIIVKNGLLQEVIIPADTLAKKGITIHSGLFMQHGYTCKLTSWKLRRGQRASIPIDSFVTLSEYANKFKSSSMIIIDELRNEPFSFGIENFGIPKSLYEKNITMHDRIRYYKESGKHNLYYPIYKNSLFQFLNIIGFQSIDIDIEQKKAALIRRKKWIPLGKNYSTYVLVAKTMKAKKNDMLSIPFTPKRFW